MHRAGVRIGRRSSAALLIPCLAGGAEQLGLLKWTDTQGPPSIAGSTKVLLSLPRERGKVIDARCLTTIVANLTLLFKLGRLKPMGDAHYYLRQLIG